MFSIRCMNACFVASCQTAFYTVESLFLDVLPTCMCISFGITVSALLDPKHSQHSHGSILTYYSYGFWLKPPFLGLPQTASLLGKALPWLL